MRLECPGCQGIKEIPDNTKIGNIIECELCAGMKFKLNSDSKGFKLIPIHYASCPDCGKMLEVPTNSTAGDKLFCCGKQHKLTFEYGAWALTESKK
ncbi:MAG: hypothetical protein HY606_12660 [Planctomycetes bacterium]|nr:hypothetical protein [Planctomycetota bacterium]